MVSHGRGAILANLNEVISVLPDVQNLPTDSRYYVDDANDGKGVVVTNTYFWGGVDAPSQVLALGVFLTEVGLPTLAAGAPVIAELAQMEDGTEYQKTTIMPDGEHIYNILWKDTTDNTLVIRPFELEPLGSWLTPSATGYYEVPANDIKNVIIANDTFTASEGFNINAQASTHGVFLIGNDAKNELSGSAYDDVMFGSGGDDILLGGEGKDQLYGGNYQDLHAIFDSHFSTAALTAINQYAAADKYDGINYMMGGAGADNLTCNNGKDYCIIDYYQADPQQTDTVYSFVATNGGMVGGASDYFVFSAQQLGITWNTISSMASAWGTLFGKAVDVVNVPHYTTTTPSGTAPTFYVNGDYLYFDNDGSGTDVAKALVKLQNTAGGNTTIGAQNILLVENFTDWDYSALNTELNHAPTIDPTSIITGAVTEDGTLTAAGQITANDTDTLTYTTTQATYGTMTIDTNGKWTYALNNANAAVQALKTNEKLTDSAVVTVDDGHGGKASQTVTVTINGVDDNTPVSIIQLANGMGNLIKPVQIDSDNDGIMETYYFWDRSGDGTSADTGMLNGGVDYVNHDVLDGIFKYASDFTTINPNAGTNTDNTYRYAEIGGVKLALPTIGDGKTQVQGDCYLRDNQTYSDLAEIWDSIGVPDGWQAASGDWRPTYWSATPSEYGHANLYFNGGNFNYFQGAFYGYYNDAYSAENNNFGFHRFYAAVQVLDIQPDTSAPSLSITGSNGTVTTGQTTFTFQFSEAVTGFDVNDITLSGGGTKGALTAVDADTYTLQVTGLTGSGTMSLDVNHLTGGVTDSAGNPLGDVPAVTQQYAVAPTYTTGQPMIDLGAYGKLIAPVHIDNNGDGVADSWFYYWDRSGDGTSANTGSLNGGVDYVNHDVLDGIFNHDINGKLNTLVKNYDGQFGTTNDYRYGEINGVKLALPTVGDGSVQVNEAYFLTDNGTYFDYAEIWDVYNSVNYKGELGVMPQGWSGPTSYYWSAEQSGTGHAGLNLDYGGVNYYGANIYAYDRTNAYVALQVL